MIHEFSLSSVAQHIFEKLPRREGLGVDDILEISEGDHFAVGNPLRLGSGTNGFYGYSQVSGEILPHVQGKVAILGRLRFMQPRRNTHITLLTQDESGDRYIHIQENTPRGLRRRIEIEEVLLFSPAQKEWELVGIWKTPPGGNRTFCEDPQDSTTAIQKIIRHAERIVNVFDRVEGRRVVQRRKDELLRQELKEAHEKREQQVTQNTSRKTSVFV